MNHTDAPWRRPQPDNQSIEEPEALDYLEMRNLDALRAWRQRYLVFAQRCQDYCVQQEIDAEDVLNEPNSL